MEIRLGMFLIILLLAFSNSPPITSSRKMELQTKEEHLEPVTQQPKRPMTNTKFDPSKAVQISWQPRLFLYEGFLSDKECEHLISLAKSNKEVSVAAQDVSDNSKPRSWNVTSGSPVARGQDEVVTKIEERISLWTFLPKENGEDVLLNYYGINESSNIIYDINNDKSKGSSGGPLATVIMYLSNISHGGETIFPKSELRNIQAKDSTLSECSAKSYAVKPARGSALLLFNVHVDATPDESSIYGSCKVIEGDKWTATKRIHPKPFNPDSKLPLPTSNEECTDEDPSCSHWAAIGECQRNAVYMIGTADYYGTCRKSCGVC